MAIVQISRITNRKGYYEDLPQLAGAELGWAVDERRLFIGNGTLEEGAPVIGNTEILTQYSNILEIAASYTYKGERAGYIVQTTDEPVIDIVRTLQDKLDEYVSVRDFGAAGDGTTDDTESINKALYELYCRGADTRTRRVLFFPAGLYIISDTLLIPPFARLVGEGINSSIIRFENDDIGFDLSTVVARTVDTAFDKNSPVGNSGATQPRDVSIEHMGFRTTLENTVFVLESVAGCQFVSVMLRGQELPVAVTNAKALEMKSQTSGVALERCVLSDTYQGLVLQDSVSDVVITGSTFRNLERAVEGVGSHSGVRIAQNTFRSITTTAVEFSATSERNITAFNTFTDCSLNTSAPIIEFQSDNNVSVGDMFNWLSPKTTGKNIETSDSTSIAFDLSDRIHVGAYTRESGRVVSLPPSTPADTEIVTLPITDYRAFKVDYGVRRGSAYRSGSITVTPRTTPSASQWDDSYVETGDAGMEVSVVSDGVDVRIQYTLVANPLESGVMHYSISKLL